MCIWDMIEIIFLFLKNQKIYTLLRSFAHCKYTYKYCCIKKNGFVITIIKKKLFSCQGVIYLITISLNSRWTEKISSSSIITLDRKHCNSTFLGEKYSLVSIETFFEFTCFPLYSKKKTVFRILRFVFL